MGDCTACGVGCGNGGGSGSMSYVGHGQGQYMQETTYRYVGCGGDFDAVRPRRDFTCFITTCCLSSLLLLPLLLWLLSGPSSSELFDCSLGEPVRSGEEALGPDSFFELPRMATRVALLRTSSGQFQEMCVRVQGFPLSP